MRSFLIALLLVLVAAVASATPPRTLSYQGVLTDDLGNTVSDGSYGIIFRLYTAASGGSPLWLESHSVPVLNGQFDVILGSVTPLTALTFNDPYWLSLQVAADPEMSPRTELTSTPYSLMAKTVEDNAITTPKIANNTVLRSLNGLEDTVNLIGGTNVTVTPVGNDIQISASSGGGGTEPGVAGAKGVTSGTLTGPGTIDNLVSRIINCPAAGYVLVIATGHIFINHVNGQPTYTLVGTSASSSSMPTNQTIITQIPSSVPSGLFTFPVTSQAVYPVSAGNNTFYMLGELGSASGTASLGDRTLSLVYIENAYGTVSSQLVYDPSTADNGVPGGKSRPAGVPAVAKTQDLERELADLRARMAKLEARLRED